MTSPPGLGYFAEFLPRAAAIAPLKMGYEQLCAHLDEGRRDLAGMTADAEAVAAAVAVMDAQLVAQEQLLRELTASWDGDAADAARVTIDGHLDRARTDRDAMAAVHAAMLEAETVLYESAQAKSEVLEALDPVAVGGVDPLGRVIESGAVWLQEVLVPHVRASLGAVLDLCAVTERITEGSHGQVRDAVSAVDPGPYPQVSAERLDLPCTAAPVGCGCAGGRAHCCCDRMGGLAADSGTHENDDSPDAARAGGADGSVRAPVGDPEPYLESMPTEQRMSTEQALTVDVEASVDEPDQDQDPRAGDAPTLGSGAELATAGSL